MLEANWKFAGREHAIRMEIAQRPRERERDASVISMQQTQDENMRSI